MISRHHYIVRIFQDLFKNAVGELRSAQHPDNKAPVKQIKDNGTFWRILFDFAYNAIVKQDSVCGFHGKPPLLVNCKGNDQSVQFGNNVVRKYG